MKTQYWIDEEDLKNTETADVWNLASKGAYTVDAEEFMKHLTKNTNLMKQWKDTVNRMQVRHLVLRGSGIDLGGGSGWVSAVLSMRPEMEHIYLVDISRIRLERMLPVAVSAFGGIAEKITPVVGSFYDIKLPDSSADFVVLNQSFHHAKYPIRLLCECNRVLKTGGILVISAEEPISERLYYSKKFYRRIKPFIKRGAVGGRQFRELFPPTKMGDRHWRLRHYHAMFDLTGFRMEYYRPGYQHKKTDYMSKMLGQMFYGNFFGVKERDYVDAPAKGKGRQHHWKIIVEILNDPERM